MGSNIEAFFNLSDQERSIIWTAAKAGSNPMTCSLFQLYFPRLSPDEIRVLVRDVGKVDDLAGVA
jgi:hypothetical protein